MPVPLEQRQRLLDEGVGDGALLQHDRPVALAARRAQQVDAAPPRPRPARGRARRGRATVSFGRVTNGAMTAGRRRSAAASSVQISAGSHGRERDHRSAREVLLQELQRLRVGVGRPVLAGLEPGVGADEDERASRARLGPSPGRRSRAGAPRCGRAARGRRRRTSRRRCGGRSVERPERMPAMASSQMPPIESVRAAGFVGGVPVARRRSPRATVLTQVEPRRSAAPTRSAPPEALL